MVMLPVNRVDSKDIDSSMEETLINSELNELREINQGSKLANIDAAEYADDESKAVKFVDNQTTLQPKLERSFTKENNKQ